MNYSITLLLLSIIIFCLSALIRKRTVVPSPQLLMSGTWLFVFSLYCINYFGFSGMSGKTFYILFFMLFFFSVGGTCSFLIKTYPERKNTTIRMAVFCALFAVSVICMLRDELPIIKEILSGKDFVTLINEAGTQSLISYSGLYGALYVFVINPFCFAVSPICAERFVNDRKGRPFFIIANVVIVLLNTFHHGGRLAIMIFLICYGLAFFAIIQKGGISYKSLVIIIPLLVIGFVSILAVTSSRGIEDAWKSFYAYFVTGIPLNDIYLESPLLFISKTDGFFSFHGLFWSLDIIWRKAGLSSLQSYQQSNYFLDYIDNSFFYIGSYDNKMNYFMPFGSYFYVDFGYIGVVILSTIYGFVCDRVYKKYLLINDSRLLSILLYLSIGIILSFIRFWFANASYALAIFYLVFLYRRETKVFGSIYE